MKEIYQKAFYIIEQYFSNEEEESKLMPCVGADAENFNFGVQDNTNFFFDFENQN